MEIRKATINDLQAITYYPDHFWLLFDDTRLISCVNGMTTNEPDLRDEMFEKTSMHTAQGDWQMIFGVITHPEYRKRGYAAALLDRVISDTRIQGRRGLVLTCKEHMLHYYAKFGFVNEGLSDSVHGNAVWYQMRLSFHSSEHE